VHKCTIWGDDSQSRNLRAVSTLLAASLHRPYSAGRFCLSAHIASLRSVQDGLGESSAFPFGIRANSKKCIGILSTQLTDFLETCVYGSGGLRQRLFEQFDEFFWHRSSYRPRVTLHSVLPVCDSLCRLRLSCVLATRPSSQWRSWRLQTWQACPSPLVWTQTLTHSPLCSCPAGSFLAHAYGALYRQRLCTYPDFQKRLLVGDKPLP
jgi:hypothetical protein